MSDINGIQITFVEKYFVDMGYVHGFSSTEKFDNFTIDSIGIPLCERYKKSKGKSLIQFLRETTNQNAAKLISDLLDYREVFDPLARADANAQLYDKCREIVDELRCKDKNHIPSDNIDEYFDSDYINAQLKQMNESVEKNPADAIGKSKELLEACCKKILSDKGVDYSDCQTVQKLVQRTLNSLNIIPSEITNDDKTRDIFDKLLRFIAGFSDQLSQLRNIHGTGHGKDVEYQGLKPAHARLVVTSTRAIVSFLLEMSTMDKSDLLDEEK